jgi:hypothetical protein
VGSIVATVVGVEVRVAEERADQKKAGSFLIPLQKLTEVNVKFSVLSDCRALACI